MYVSLTGVAPSVVLVFLFVKHIGIPVSTMSVDVVDEPGDELVDNDETTGGGPAIGDGSGLLSAGGSPVVAIVGAFGVGVGFSAVVVVFIDALGNKNTSNREVHDGHCPTSELRVPSSEPLEGISAVEVSVSQTQE